MATSLFNISGGVQQLLENFGLANNWNLATCSYELPNLATLQPITDLTEKRNNTITFIDMSSVLGIDGLNIDFSTIPTLELALQTLTDYRTQSSADKSGKTLVASDSVVYENNNLTYQLPNGNEIVKSWGNKATKFTITAVLYGAGYIDKAKAVASLLTNNLGMQGGVFKHAIYGEFPNTFVSRVRVTSSTAIFNASMLAIEFITPSLYNIAKDVPTPLATKILGYVGTANAILQTISSLPNTVDQIKALVVNPLLTMGGATSVLNPTTDGRMENTFTQPSFSDPSVESAGGASIDVLAASPDLSYAYRTLTLSGLPLDYDIASNTQIVMESLTQFSGLVVAGYGTGYTTAIESVPEVYLSMANIIFVENKTLPNGALESIVRQVVRQNDQGEYEVIATITRQIPSETLISLDEIRGTIDSIISVCSVYAFLYADQYALFTDLVATLENFYWSVVTEGAGIVELSSNATVLGLSLANNTSLSRIFARNPQLVAQRPLEKGMRVYL